jgi:hypothetical protein
MIGRTMMNNPNQDKDPEEEESSGKKKENERPAFPFKRKPV